MASAAPEVQSAFLSLPERVLSAAARFGGRPAIRGERTRLTYAELEAEIHAVAAALLDRLGDRNDVVVLLYAQDAPLVAALLGTLAAGKVYVVADPVHPPETLAAIVQDSTARLVLADPEHLALASRIAGDVPVADASRLPRPSRAGTLPAADPAMPAALYYTSGSTGAPKGVVKSQERMADSATPMVGFLDDRDRFGLTASLGFSNSTGAFLAPLVKGGSVSMLDGTPRSTEQLTAWLEDEEITIFRTTPSTFRSVARARADRPFAAFRLVVLGAEASYGRDMELFRRLTGPGAVLRLSWGSTEAGGVTQRLLTRDDEVEPGILHSGWPTQGTLLTTLDEDGRATGAGVPGRLAITSRRLALGYWRRPDLDAESFRADPRDPSLRTFLTRDVARLRPDGALEWMGRLDHQVKVRGQAVDPAAVEAALMSLAGVTEAAVVAHAGAEGTRLAAYVAGASRDGRSLRRELGGLLPAHMVPATVQTFESLPRNANGKLDRRALPAPAAPGPGGEAGDVPEALLALFAAALGRPTAGAGDDFFEAGGDSLGAASLLAGISATYGLDLPPTVLWEAPTPRELAAVVAARGEGVARTLIPVRDGADLPLFWVPGIDRDFHGEHNDLVGLKVLGRLLGPEPPLAAFHYDPRGVAPGTALDTAAVARRFVDAMRSRQPEGPYRIVGFSMGARIAWEMAQQLTAAGQTLSLLALLDPYGPGYPRRRTWAEPAQWLSFARRAGRVGLRLLRPGPRGGLTELKRAATVFGQRGLVPEAGLDLRWKPYTYQPYDGPVLLLRSQLRPTDHGLDWSDPTNGFGPLAPRLEVAAIPGRHEQALRPGHIETVARVLAARLGLPGAEGCDPVEERLGALVAPLVRIGIPHHDADFFAYGGTDEGARALLVEIEKVFGVKLPRATLDTAPTISSLAEAIRAAARPWARR